MYRVLVTSRSFAKGSNEPIQYLEQNECTVEYAERGQLQSSELQQLIKGYDALIVGIDQVDRAVLEAADRLKVVCMHGTGIDHIDVRAATEKGIYVGNVPGANGNSVAELAVGLMITAARHVVVSDRSVRQHGWERRVGTELSHKTMGFVGLGHIGKRVAELMTGFEMNYLAYDLVQDQAFAEKLGIRYVDLPQLLQLSDVVTLHLPLTDQTMNLISHAELSLMKPNAILVNTSRGALVDEQALYDALTNHRIGAAALDSFAHEPLEQNSPLRDLDNVVLTAHIGASTYDAANRVDMVNARTIVSVLTGAEPFSVVNADLIQRQS